MEPVCSWIGCDVPSVLNPLAVDLVHTEEVVVKLVWGLGLGSDTNNVQVVIVMGDNFEAHVIYFVEDWWVGWLGHPNNLC